MHPAWAETCVSNNPEYVWECLGCALEEFEEGLGVEPEGGA